MLATVPDWQVGAIPARCARRDLVVEEIELLAEALTKRSLMWVVSCPRIVTRMQVMTFESCRKSPPHSDWAQGLPPWWRGDAVSGARGSESVVIVRLVCAEGGSEDGGLERGRGA